ncbi:hypothetical protein TrLO_g6871, partial [Triparma laevis f. longispina]
QEGGQGGGGRGGGGGGKGEFSTELEILYIQREKELLAKLADAMMQMKTTTAAGGEDKGLMGTGGATKRRKVGKPMTITVDQQEWRLQKGGGEDISPCNVPLSPKRGAGKPGLHQPTASSRSKNLLQIEKMKRMQRAGKAAVMLKKGAGIGGGNIVKGRG